MSTNEPELAERLNRRLLAASQLQIRVTRSVALDAGARGVMTVDFAAAAIFGARGGSQGLAGRSSFDSDGLGLMRIQAGGPPPAVPDGSGMV